METAWNIWTIRCCKRLGNQKISDEDSINRWKKTMSTNIRNNITFKMKGLITRRKQNLARLIKKYENFELVALNKRTSAPVYWDSKA
jgi:hypothetical protein